MNTTRTVSVWLANDEPMYHEALERARVAIGKNMEDDELDRDSAVDDLAADLKDWIGGLRPVKKGLFGDLLNDALSEVDWYDVAADFIDDDE